IFWIQRPSFPPPSPEVLRAVLPASVTCRRIRENRSRNDKRGKGEFRLQEGRLVWPVPRAHPRRWGPDASTGAALSDPPSEASPPLCRSPSEFPRSVSFARGRASTRPAGRGRRFCRAAHPRFLFLGSLVEDQTGPIHS